jgi:hypothetical protein
VARAPYAVSAIFTVTAVGWSARLAVDPEPFGAAPGALLAVDLAVLAVVTVAGLLLARGRWARIAAIGESAAWLVLAAVMPLDHAGLALLVAAGASLCATAGPWLTRDWLRRRPSADGPPPGAVAAMLGLLAVPGIAAAAAGTDLRPLDWALSGFAVAAAWGLGRGTAAALWALRLGLAPLAAATGLTAALPRGLAVIAVGIGVTAAGWRREVTLAIRPLAAVRRVPIPPELAPPEILEAAGYDDRGHPAEGR